MDPNQNPIARLLGSSKAIIMMITILMAFAALFVGKATWEQVSTLVQWVVPVWLGAQGIEDAAKSFGASKATTLLAQQPKIELVTK